MSQSFIHQVGILFFNFWVLTFEFLTYESQSFIHQVRILSWAYINDVFEFSNLSRSQSFIHQVRILSKWGDFVEIQLGGTVAILYSSSQNSLANMMISEIAPAWRRRKSQSFIHQVRILSGNEVSHTGAAPVVAILYSSSQNSLPYLKNLPRKTET